MNNLQVSYLVLDCGGVSATNALGFFTISWSTRMNSGMSRQDGWDTETASLWGHTGGYLQTLR